MRLGEYLEQNGIKRGDFAREIDISPSWITWLCNGNGWPSRDVAEKITKATNGEVTADDFLQIEENAATADGEPTVAAE